MWIGFLLPTLGGVTLDHFMKRPDPGEILDSMSVAMVFTAVFAAGVRLGPGRGEGQAAEGSGFPAGLAAGLGVQAVMWGFWLAVPHGVRYSFGPWPLLAHMILMIAAGYTLSRLRRPRVSGA